MTKDVGRVGKPTGLSQVEPQERLAPSGFDPARMEHQQYGPCDGFGPMWTCSQCTGVIACSDGTFVEVGGDKLSPDEASARLGDFLLDQAERAALAAWGCCDSPEAISEFMRVSLILPFPGEPWRHRALFERAIRDSDGGAQ